LLRDPELAVRRMRTLADTWRRLEASVFSSAGESSWLVLVRDSVEWMAGSRVAAEPCADRGYCVAATSAGVLTAPEDKTARYKSRA
jgi:hypothetical protein